MIVLTVHGDVELATEALRAGASGFIVKETVVPELVAAIRAVLRGKVYVTPAIRVEGREVRVEREVDLGRYRHQRGEDALELRSGYGTRAG